MTELADIAGHLRRRRNQIVQTWREAVHRDPLLTTSASLPRQQLNDHVPALIRSFERRLDPSFTDDDGMEVEAAAHGLHRWQQGYDLREVARELGRLNECMVSELDALATMVPAGALSRARSCWAELYSVTIGESTAQYYRLQQVEAESQVRDLEQALATLRDLEQQRATLWKEAAHDLRGNVGVVVNATAGLTSENATDTHRASFLRMLERNLASLQHLIDDVTGLARLQAGIETRSLEPFDAAVLFTDLCDGLRGFAREAGLDLTTDGPTPFEIVGDHVKVRRLTQNLVINALKYTRVGTVHVVWGDADSKRWSITVKDTGPGLHAGPGSPIASALGQATELVQQVTENAGRAEPLATVTHGDADARSRRTEPGEGLGLSIVKRLAELLDASVEVSSEPEVGTTFRVLLPRNYDS